MDKKDALITMLQTFPTTESVLHLCREWGIDFIRPDGFMTMWEKMENIRLLAIDALSNPELPPLIPHDETSISVLQLSTRTENSLRRVGIQTIEDVKRLLHKNENLILAIRGVGEITIQELKVAIELYDQTMETNA